MIGTVCAMIVANVLPILVPSLIAFGAVLIAAVMAHLYGLRQWRYERRHEAIGAFLSVVNTAAFFAMELNDIEADDEVEFEHNVTRFRRRNPDYSYFRQGQAILGAQSSLELVASAETVRLAAMLRNSAVALLGTANLNLTLDGATGRDGDHGVHLYQRLESDRKRFVEQARKDIKAESRL